MPYLQYLFTLDGEHTIRIAHKLVVVGARCATLEHNLEFIGCLLGHLELIALVALHDQVQLWVNKIDYIFLGIIYPHGILHAQESIPFVDVLREYVYPGILLWNELYFHGVFFSVEMFTSRLSFWSPFLSRPRYIAINCTDLGLRGMQIRFTAYLLHLVHSGHNINYVLIIDIARTLLLKCVAWKYSVACFIRVFVFESHSIYDTNEIL